MCRMSAACVDCAGVSDGARRTAGSCRNSHEFYLSLAERSDLCLDRPIGMVDSLELVPYLSKRINFGQEETMFKQVLLAVMLVVMVTASCGAQTFSDVPKEHWAHDAVEKAARLGLVVGRGDGTYKGDNSPTRYELAMGMSKVLAEIENRMKAQPIFTRKVLEQLRQLNLHLASQVDEVRYRQTYLIYMLEHHYNKAHAQALPDLTAEFQKDVRKKLLESKLPSKN